MNGMWHTQTLQVIGPHESLLASLKKNVANVAACAYYQDRKLIAVYTVTLIIFSMHLFI